MRMAKDIRFVVAGQNGSGKTTITEKQLRHEWMDEYQYINLDVIAQQEVGDCYPLFAVSILRIFNNSHRKITLCQR